MIHAYSKLLLPRAEDSLGRMLDFSVHSLHREASEMMELFVASSTGILFGRGDIRIIAGMSGTELAYEVLSSSGLRYERVTPRHTMRLSPEYWCGYTLALIQWERSLSFDEILTFFSIPGFISDYEKERSGFLGSLPLDISEQERYEQLKSFGEDFAAEAAAGRSSAEADEGTPLRKMRIKNGLSQSGLAEACAIPVRTIQQYEQRQKDLSKARSSYLISLASALNCDPASLLER